MSSDKSTMPDVATSLLAQHLETLNWVGMSRIAIPITIDDEQLGVCRSNAQVDVHVNVINPEVKGIHMSRLYLLLSDFAKENALTVPHIKRFLQQALASHSGISDSACIQFDFDFMMQSPALKSQYSGWKAYPATLRAEIKEGSVCFELSVQVAYSSTCPCSSALARQLLEAAFRKDFADSDSVDREAVEAWLRSDRGSVATPHSQRSYAKVLVQLNETQHSSLPIKSLIDSIEATLKTPVQTAVKREDEQEFARLNGANQMFCEDAARRLKSMLNQSSHYQDFWLRIEHIESLHAHDAVAIATKDVKGGYTPLLQR